MEDLDYVSLTSNLVANSDVQTSDIFQFQDTPLAGICENLFNFCQQSFYRDIQVYSLNPCYLFFGSKTEINAWADKNRGNYIVCIYIGTLVKIRDIFLRDEDYTSDCGDRNNLNKIVKIKNDSIQFLLFQSSFLFIFYHEVGHLLQKSNGSIKYEIDNNIDSYTEMKHIKEVDADIFASMQLARHLLQYYDDITQISIDDLSSLLSLLCVGPSIFQLSFIEFSKEIYFKEKSHPHSIVRLFIILDTIINYTILYFNLERDQELNLRNALMNKTIKLLDELLPIILNKDIRDLLISNFKMHQNEIINYTEILLEAVKTYEEGALNKFNNIAKKYKE